MGKYFLAAFLAMAVLSAGSTAHADEAADRNAAIWLCRAEVAEQAGVAVEEARLDSVRTRARAFRVDIDLWKNGTLTNVRCDVDRTQALTIAAISPALSTATAAR